MSLNIQQLFVFFPEIQLFYKYLLTGRDDTRWSQGILCHAHSPASFLFQYTEALLVDAILMMTDSILHVSFRGNWTDAPSRSCQDDIPEPEEWIETSEELHQALLMVNTFTYITQLGGGGFS